jgi:hypothetical protein
MLSCDQKIASEWTIVCDPYLLRLVHRAYSDGVCLRPPPEAHELGRGSDIVQLVDDVIEFEGFLYFSQAESCADLHSDVKNDAGAAQATERGVEQVWLVIAGARDLCSISLEQAHSLHVRRKNSVMDARAVGGCGYHTGERLFRDGSEVDHGEAVGLEDGVQVLKCDAALGVNEALFEIDLGEKIKSD